MSHPSFSSPFIIIIILTIIISSSAGVEAEEPLTVYDVLEQYNFPIGLLPKGVKGYEMNRNSGSFKVYLNETCSYSVQGYQMKYGSTITGVIREDRIYNLRGISVNVIFLWWNIQEVRRKGDELELSVGIASASFSIDQFYECPQCGCGFDCLNGGMRKKKKKMRMQRLNMNRLISYLLDP